MNRHIFLTAPNVAPSSRWRVAFPDGLEVDAVARLHANETCLLWVSVGHPNWLELLECARASLPDAALAVVSNRPDRAEGIQALMAGARAYCHGLAAPAQFREVALVLSHGGHWIGADLMTTLVRGAHTLRMPSDAVATLVDLSERESEVASAVEAGLANKEIARRLGITERTVKAHLSSIFEKLGVRDRLQLVVRLSAMRASCDLEGHS